MVKETFSQACQSRRKNFRRIQNHHSAQKVNRGIPFSPLSKSAAVPDRTCCWSNLFDFSMFGNIYQTYPTVGTEGPAMEYQYNTEFCRFFSNCPDQPHEHDGFTIVPLLPIGFPTIVPGLIQSPKPLYNGYLSTIEPPLLENIISKEN